MNLLALDTSSVACTVAVQHGDEVFERHEEQPREHTRLLMPMIRAVLADADVELSGLDGIVLGNGPGSFIGMRIAASVAQGLAYGAGLNIAPVSSMAAIAAEVTVDQTGHVAVAQDAHMNEVYFGIYKRDDKGLAEIVAERLQACEAIPELSDIENCVAAGFGWQRFPALLETNRACLGRVSKVYYPSSRFLLELGNSAFRGGETVAAADVVPAYLRQKVAEKPRGKV